MVSRDFLARRRFGKVFLSPLLGVPPILTSLIPTVGFRPGEHGFAPSGPAHELKGAFRDLKPPKPLAAHDASGVGIALDGAIARGGVHYSPIDEIRGGQNLVTRAKNGLP